MPNPTLCRASGSSARARQDLSPDDRRNELLALGAEVFGQRPYDEVRIDEIAERAGVSRALMYHYFPDKRAFFAAVVRAEGERLFEATNTPPQPGQSLFDQLRAGVLAYLHYDEAHPHGAWAAYIGMGRSDPVLRGIDDIDNDRQANRIIDRITEAARRTAGLQGRARPAGHRLRLAGVHVRDCAGSASSTRRSTQATSPTRARTPCSTPSRACRASPASRDFGRFVFVAVTATDARSKSRGCRWVGALWLGGPQARRLHSRASAR